MSWSVGSPHGTKPIGCLNIVRAVPEAVCCFLICSRLSSHSSPEVPSVQNIIILVKILWTWNITATFQSYPKKEIFILTHQWVGRSSIYFSYKATHSLVFQPSSTCFCLPHFQFIQPCQFYCRSCLSFFSSVQHCHHVEALVAPDKTVLETWRTWTKTCSCTVVLYLSIFYFTTPFQREILYFFCSTTRPPFLDKQNISCKIQCTDRDELFLLSR